MNIELICTFFSYYIGSISNSQSTNPQPGGPRNIIADALAKRVILAAKAGENFQVISGHFFFLVVT